MQVRLVENLWIGLSISAVVISNVRGELAAKDLKNATLAIYTLGT
jgi:hypothetical protein